MNDGRNGNDGAFAMATVDGFTQYGLSKREYYSAVAMQGILANRNIVHAIKLKDIPLITEASVILADNLIEQLDKEAEGERSE